MIESKRWLDCQVVSISNGKYGLYCSNGATPMLYTEYTTRTEAEQARDLWLIKQKL